MMKRVFLLVTLLSALIISCSTDKEEVGVEEELILGTWVLSDVKIDATKANSELVFAKGIVDILLAKKCGLLEFFFAKGGSITTKSKINAIQVDLNEAGNGIAVDCPATTETEEATWRLEGDKLFITTDNEEKVLTIVLTEDSLTIDGKDINPDNYTGAALVFVKK